MKKFKRYIFKLIFILSVLFSTTMVRAQKVEIPAVVKVAENTWHNWVTASDQLYEDTNPTKEMRKKRKKNEKESSTVFKMKKIKPSNLSLEQILVFEDFGFNETSEIKNYQVYYFLQNQKNDVNYIAEGDIYLNNNNQIISFDIDVVHSAKTLREYIRLRAEQDMIESHPPSVNEFMNHGK